MAAPAYNFKGGAGHAKAGPAQGRRNMVTGISTACLYPMETEKALEIMLGQGYRCFEVFLNSFGEMEKPFLRELKAMAAHYGARFVSVHPFTAVVESPLLFQTYPRRTEEGFRLYLKYMEAAAFLGAQYVVIHGAPRQSLWLEDEAYWERFGELYRRAASTGARPAQENVRTYKSLDPAFLKGMREYLGVDCAFVLDVKQCRITGQPVEAVSAAMGDRLCHVHLSDCRGEQPCLLPGAGDFDFPGFRRLLEGMGYQGAVVTEVYRSGFGGLEELEAARLAVEKAFRR